MASPKARLVWIVALVVVFLAVKDKVREAFGALAQRRVEP